MGTETSQGRLLADAARGAGHHSGTPVKRPVLQAGLSQ